MSQVRVFGKVIPIVKLLSLLLGVKLTHSPLPVDVQLHDGLDQEVEPLMLILSMVRSRVLATTDVEPLHQHHPAEPGRIGRATTRLQPRSPTGTGGRDAGAGRRVVFWRCAQHKSS